jgi:hypothetical protein
MHMIIESQTCNVFSISYRVTALAEVELIFYRYFKTENFKAAILLLQQNPLTLSGLR